MGTSTIRLRSIKSSLPSLYPLRHSRDKIFQALYRFSVLQATESWAGPGNEASYVQYNCSLAWPDPTLPDLAMRVSSHSSEIDLTKTKNCQAGLPLSESDFLGGVRERCLAWLSPATSLPNVLLVCHKNHTSWTSDNHFEWGSNEIRIYMYSIYT